MSCCDLLLALLLLLLWLLLVVVVVVADDIEATAGAKSLQCTGVRFSNMVAKQVAALFARRHLDAWRRVL